MTELTAAEIISLLDLQPHPEGGYFRETFRDARTIDGKRAASTAIFFLLTQAKKSHWHRVDATEVWHWHAGAPLKLSVAEDGKSADHLTLGPDIASGDRPQAVVPVRVWQAAETLGEWTLAGCTVAPGFEFAGFELAPPGWAPP